MTVHKVGPDHYEVRRDGEVIAYVEGIPHEWKHLIDC